MKALSRVQRADNIRRKQPETCRWCGDTGYVVAQQRVDPPCAVHGTPIHSRKVCEPVDEMAPCPFCLAGYRCEFPESSQPSELPWGADGFWAGRDTAELQPLRSASGRVMSRPEQLAALRTLQEAIGLRIPAPDAGLPEGEEW